MTMKTMHLPAALLALALAAPAAAQRTPIATPKPLPSDIAPRVSLEQCGDFTGHFGPLDYRSSHPFDRRLVEKYHFDMEMSTFLSGRVSGRNRAGTGGVAGGFDYVLKAFPNHPAALLVMDQLGRKLKSEQPQNIDMPIECYYVRAFMIAPDDPVVRAMYGIYLAHRDRRPEAVHNLDLADEALRWSGPVQYQIGLANLTLKRYDKAQLNAMRAARDNFPLDALRKDLKSAGKWDANLALPAEEVAASAEAASAAATSDAAASAAPAASAASSPR
jgi:hypothetical protein